MALYSGSATLLMASALEMVQSDKARRTDMKYTSDKKHLVWSGKTTICHHEFSQTAFRISWGGGGGGVPWNK